MNHASELAEALGRNGFTHQNFQAFIQHPNLAARLAAYADSLVDQHPETDVRLAAQIMGNNFFGFEKMEAHLVIDISDEDRRQKSPVPFSPKTLKLHRDSHILVFVPGGKLDQLLKCSDHIVNFESIESISDKNGWKFWTERRWGEWHLIAKKGRLETIPWAGQSEYFRMLKQDAVSSVRTTLVALCLRRNGSENDLFMPWRCCLHNFHRDQKTVLVGNPAGKKPVTVSVDAPRRGVRLMTEVMQGT